jgi:SulP family sulfate permease
MFRPESWRLFKAGAYSKERLTKDLMAGIIVGIVALPLAIAFAIASGVTPQQGIYTAIIAGFIISALGGSRVQIGGPTGAFIIIVLGIVQEFGYSGLAVATLMAGFLLIIMGLVRLGSVIQFIPYPMTVGFTSGIAVIIGLSQLKDFFGVATTSVLWSDPLNWLQKPTILVGIAAMGIILLWQRINKSLPGSIVAIVLTTLVVTLLGIDTPTIGSRFGEIPNHLPMPSFPEIPWTTLHELIRPALAIAMLGAIESLLSAVVADGMAGGRHHSNTELIAQGIANLASPLFGGIPATGAIARTATNIKNGGSTPVSGMVHALTLLGLLLFFGRWVALVPIATLSAILLIVAYHMSEWRHFVKLLKAPKSDIFVLVTTFFLTVAVDLTIAIEVGLVLSAMLFMKRMSDVTHFETISQEGDGPAHPEDLGAVSKETLPEDVLVFEIHGPFFFGAANKFKDTLALLNASPRILIIRMRHVLTIDATGLQAFEEMIDKTRKEGTIVLLSGVKPDLQQRLLKTGLVDKIGPQHIFSSIDEALLAARSIAQAPHQAKRH